MLAANLCAGAIGSHRLVRNDRDRLRLRDAIREELRAAVLAYCVMDTHVHVVAEAPPEHARRWLENALRLYAHGYNRAHRCTEGPLLRGKIDAREVPSTRELARAIYYAHDNPRRTEEPIVGRAVDFEWSSAREYAGLSGARIANVPRALALLGADAWRARPRAPALADLEPAPWPRIPPAVLLAAACQAFGVLGEDVRGRGHGPELQDARTVFARLGELDGYNQEQLAPFLGRSRSQVCRLASRALAPEFVRVARTILRDPALRARLPDLEARRVA